MSVASAQRRDAIHAFVVEFYTTNGYSPSLREIGETVGITSSSIVHAYVAQLVDAGMLRKTPGIARSYRPA